MIICGVPVRAEYPCGAKAEQLLDLSVGILDLGSCGRFRKAFFRPNFIYYNTSEQGNCKQAQTMNRKLTTKLPISDSRFGHFPFRLGSLALRFSCLRSEIFQR